MTCLPACPLRRADTAAIQGNIGRIRDHEVGGADGFRQRRTEPIREIEPNHTPALGEPVPNQVLRRELDQVREALDEEQLPRASQVIEGERHRPDARAQIQGEPGWAGPQGEAGEQERVDIGSIPVPSRRLGERDRTSEERILGEGSSPHEKC